MEKKTKYIIVGIVIIVVVALAGASLFYFPGLLSPEETSRRAEQVKVALVLGGEIVDLSWSSVHIEALQKLSEDMGINYSYTGWVTPADSERVIRGYATRGYDLIIASNIWYKDYALAVAADFPDVHFLVMASEPLELPNVNTYTPSLHESTYLEGIIAGMMTKTNVIGIVMAFQMPATIAGYNAYKMGATEVNPDVKVLLTFAGTWDDFAKGREIALAQIEQGADIVSGYGDGMTMGVIKACEEKGIYAFGYIGDQNILAPDTVITSHLWNLYPAIKDSILQILDGKFGRTHFVQGLAEQGTDIAPFHSFENIVPQKVKDYVQRRRQEIIDGKFVVPEITTLED